MEASEAPKVEIKSGTRMVPILKAFGDLRDGDLIVKEHNLDRIVGDVVLLEGEDSPLHPEPAYAVQTENSGALAAASRDIAMLTYIRETSFTLALGL